MEFPGWKSSEPDWQGKLPILQKCPKGETGGFVWMLQKAERKDHLQCK